LRIVNTAPAHDGKNLAFRALKGDAIRRVAASTTPTATNTATAGYGQCVIGYKVAAIGDVARERAAGQRHCGVHYRGIRCGNVEDATPAAPADIVGDGAVGRAQRAEELKITPPKLLVLPLAVLLARVTVPP